MAQITYRANLSAKSFPFLSQNWGRTVIVPQYDNTFSRQLSSTEDVDKDVGIPQIFYCHNVMPHQQGFQSVGYQTLITGVPAASFSSVYLIRDALDNKTYLGVTTDGKFYTLVSGLWVYKATYPVGTVTVAYVNGVTYIYIANYGCVQYNFSSGTFGAITLTALDVTNVSGITSSAGYLIAWSGPRTGTSLTFTSTAGSNFLTGVSGAGLAIGMSVTGPGVPAGSVITYIPVIFTGIQISQNATSSGINTFSFGAQAAAVAWSSTIDPTDFTPSLVTGAGGGSIEAARGAITCCVSHLQGFIIYTSNNAVVAAFSGNPRYPFNFREIVGSGGLSTINNVTYDANTTNHYAYTTSGLQLVSTTQTQTILPEVTDFISGRLIEDYDEVIDTFSSTVISTPLRKAMTLVADRYLVISYGNGSLTHALVHDLIDRRWGKLKIPHVQCFEYSIPSAALIEIPRQSMAFLQSDGTIKVVDLSVNSATSNGVIALGKYQYVRQRLLQLDEIHVENVPGEPAFSIYDNVALDGKNSSKNTPYLYKADGLYRRYLCRAATGINHSLVMKGAFSLVSLELTFHVHGKR